MADTPLAGVRVLVTRPAHQAEGLCRLIERAGGVPVRFPTIEIAPPRDPTALEHIAARLDEFDLAIFISPNAIEYAMRRIRAQRDTLPRQLSIACIGPGSKAALRRFDIENVIVPDTRSDSEGLLDMPRLREVGGQHVVIFRGEGGREMLAQTLAERGAVVEYVECYRRMRPQTDARELWQAFAQRAIDVVTVTSADALKNLFDMLDAPGQESLLRTPVIAVSERLRRDCQTLGLWGPIHVTDVASDEAIAAALCEWRRSQKSL